MIHHIKDNLLTSDCNFIAHQSNCLGGFGAGFAGQVRVVHPSMLQAFMGDPRTPEEKLGQLSYARIKGGWGFNLYGQFNYGGQKCARVDTVYPALEQAFGRMLTMVPELARFSRIDRIKVGVPYRIGCALAGGDWKIVADIIETQSKLHSIDVHLYEYTPPRNR